MRIDNSHIASALLRFTQKQALSLKKATPTVKQPQVVVNGTKDKSLVYSQESVRLSTNSGRSTKITAELSASTQLGKEIPKGYSRLIMGGEMVAEKLAAFRGAGDATTETALREDLSGGEHWLMSIAHGAKSISAMAAQNISASFIPVDETGSGDGYGMRVRYTENSSQENPIMMVETLDELGEKRSYLVDLNKVDAVNASVIEGFALLAHVSAGNARDGKLDTTTAGLAMRNIMQRSLYYTDAIEQVSYESGVTSPVAGAPAQWVTDSDRLGFQERFNFLIASKDSPKEEREGFVFAPIGNFAQRATTPFEEAKAREKGEIVQSKAEETAGESSVFSSVEKVKDERKKAISTLEFMQEQNRSRKERIAVEKRNFSAFFYL